MNTCRKQLAVHFVGGNGLAISSYTPFLRALEACMPADGEAVVTSTTDLSSLNHLASSRSFGETGVWDAATDLIINDARDAHGAGGCVVVGHSLGGALTLCAAARAEPGTFTKVVIIDPPLFHSAKRVAALLLNKIGILPGKNPLATAALRRRRDFDSKEHVYTHYSGRGTFAEWHPDSLRAFAEDGVCAVPKADGAGVTLQFTPDLEAAFFAETPTEVDFLPHHWNPTQPWLNQYTPPPTIVGHYLYSTQHTLTSEADISCKSVVDSYAYSTQ